MSSMTWIEPALIVATVGVIISILIAFRQEKQLKRQAQQISQLNSISAQTKIIAESSHENKNKIDRISKYFKISKRDSKYTIIYPSYFGGKPLDSISAGDYFALNTICSALHMALLDEKNIELRPVSPHEAESIPKAEGDLIFVCSPMANMTLKAFLEPSIIRSDSDVADLPKSKTSQQVPCWFVHDLRNGREVLKIWDLKEPGHVPLTSPADAAYEQAAIARANGEKTFIPIEELQEDYAILLRTRLEDKYLFVVAGIHQYGTWIGAQYLREIFSGTSDDYNLLLLGEDDFLISIKGEFSHSKLSVTAAEVASSRMIWRRTRGGEWERFDRRRHVS